ncbi:MAG TPA: hypothetical protein VKV79_01110 [Terriglobia bacterium]|nr:hypothetical protein [Terriglobia bacterium]
MKLAWCSMLIATLSAAAAAQSLVTSTPADRKSLSLTVYNSGSALVRDTRKLQIPAGRVKLQFQGVAEKLDPTSAQLLSRSSPGALAVLEENYENRLLTPQNLLEAYVGKTLTLVRTRMENNSVVEQPVEAKLLALSPGGPVWEMNGRVVTGLSADHYVFPSVPPDFYSQPTLVWLLDNHNTARQTVTVSYLANGITWSADYVLTIARDGRTASLDGRVTLSNHSGLACPNAKLQLVAGQVARAERPPRPLNGRVQMAMAGSMAPQFAQQNLSAYHLYTLTHRTTLRDGETKLAGLFSATGIPSTQRYEVHGQSSYYRFPLLSAAPQRDPVEVHVQFTNSRANSLGMPLPGGMVRAYQPDSTGRLQLIGETTLGATPLDEVVDLNLGSAFDIIEKRKQTEYRRLGSDASEAAFEVTLRNQRAQPVRVQVTEPFDGDWQMIHSNLPYQKANAFAARFTVTVPAHGQAVLNYTVQVRWGNTP